MITKKWIQQRLFRDEMFLDRAVRGLSDEEKAGILLFGPENAKLPEAIYWAVHDLRDYPKKCEGCGNPVTFFTSFNQGYARRFCSGKCSNGSKAVQEEKKKTSRELYGTDFPWQQKEIKQKIASKQSIRNFVKVPTIREEVEAQCFKILQWDAEKMSNPALLRCKDGHEFLRQIEGWNRWNITCPKCSLTRSKGEVEVEDFIEKLGFEVATTGKRKLLEGNLEIDIFVPSRKLGIEYNGEHFHSSNTPKDRKAKFRHIEKQNIAEANGIQLLQIWESEWQQKREIVKSRIKHALGLSTSVFARRCTVIKVSSPDAKEFLVKHHIQGACIASNNYGLIQNGELIALMTFAKPRFSKKAEWELLRYCTKPGASVVGGASKLFMAFVKEHDPSTAISYADRRWSRGNLYRTIGFEEVGKPAPGYWYFKSGQGIMHRMGFQKHRLEKKLTYFDAKLSEEDNMLLNGYRVLWDCGNLTFIWSKK